MPHRADGRAGICHKRGSILPGVNSSGVWLWGNNADAFSFKRAVLWTDLFFFLAVTEVCLQGLSSFMKGVCVFFSCYAQLIKAPLG